MATISEDNNRSEQLLSSLSSSTFNLTSSVPRAKNGKTLLPSSFVPSKHSVVCGRGKACTSALGNMRLKLIIGGFLNQYSAAKNKLEKSAIVSSIIAMVKQSAPEGAFVKFEQGVWWEVEDGVAREKVGCMLRDSLHTQYRSSTKAKLARRRARKTMACDCGCNGNNQICMSSLYQGMNIHNNYNNNTITTPHNIIDQFGLNCNNNNKNELFNNSNHNNSFNPFMQPGNDNSLSGGSNHSTSSLVSEEPSSLTTKDQEHQMNAQQLMPSFSSVVPTTASSDPLMMPEEQKQDNNNTFCDNNEKMTPQFQRTNFLRDVMPMSTHLDILGSFDNGTSNFAFGSVSSQSTHSKVHSALEEACDLISSSLSENDLPDDIDNIFD